MKRNTSKLIVICLMTLMLTAALAGCGSKGVDGYYIYEKQQGQIYALEISGDTAALYYSVAGGHTIEASVDKTDEGADLYFGESPSTFLNEWNDFNPMHVKISDDGKRMYLTSDSSGWSALTFEVVSKKEFDEAIDNASTVKQGVQDQPDSSQPSEPADTTTDEPQNNAGVLPEGGFYLHDGVHYLSMFSDPDNISSAVFSGEKAANTVHEISVERGENHSGYACGSMSLALGQTAEPFNYQISFADESAYAYEFGEGEYVEFNGVGQTVAPGETKSFGLDTSYALVVNPSDEEKTVADCPIYHFVCPIGEFINDNDKIALDGQPIAKLDDLINILGTPAAAYTMDSAVYYIWQFEDFIYTAWIQADEVEEKFDEARQSVYFDVNWDTARVCALSYYALDYLNLGGTNYLGLELWATAWPVQALTDLGLL